MSDLQKLTIQIVPKKLLIKKDKNTVLWTYVIKDGNGEELFGIYYEKESQKTIKQSLGVKKQSRQKAINYMRGGNVIIICLIAV